jgi:O-antigen ligase
MVKSGISSSKLLVAASLYFFSVLLLTVYLVFETSKLELGWEWLVFIGASTLVLSFTPRFPILSILVYLLLAYSPDHYSADVMNIQSAVPVLPLVALFGLFGCLIWTLRSGSFHALRHPVSIVFVFFILWLVIASFVGYLNGHFVDWTSFPAHHPVQYLEGFILYFIATQLLGKKSFSLTVSLYLALILSIRCLLQGFKGIYLDNDLGVLIPIVLPIIGFSIFLTDKLPIRLLLAGLMCFLIVMLAYTSNRAGAVAIVFSLLVILWQYRKRWKPMAAIALVLCLILVLTPSAYTDRFRVLWDPGADHATAKLDRSSINGRLNLWRGGIEITKNNPWLGVGPGNYESLIGRYSKMDAGKSAHNNFLNIAADTGIIGLALYILLFGSGLYFASVIFKKKPRPWPSVGGQMLQVSLLTYLVVGLFMSRQDMVLAYILLGWVTALDIATRDTSSDAPAIESDHHLCDNEPSQQNS